METVAENPSTTHRKKNTFFQEKYESLIKVDRTDLYLGLNKKQNTQNFQFLHNQFRVKLLKLSFFLNEVLVTKRFSKKKKNSEGPHGCLQLNKECFVKIFRFIVHSLIMLWEFGYQFFIQSKDLKLGLFLLT
jgi:hypothetical protein